MSHLRNYTCFLFILFCLFIHRYSLGIHIDSVFWFLSWTCHSFPMPSPSVTLRLLNVVKPLKEYMPTSFIDTNQSNTSLLPYQFYAPQLSLLSFGRSSFNHFAGGAELGGDTPEWCGRSCKNGLFCGANGGDSRLAGQERVRKRSWRYATHLA